MGKPDDIPQDVWDAADAKFRDESFRHVMGDLDGPVHVIARAIMAERERAALKCEEQAKTFLSTEYAFNQPLGSLLERFACDECAKAIRSPDQKQVG